MCECQIYFARRQEGDKSEMPHFAGQRGPEILRGLTEIEAVFDKNLAMLYEVKKMILDVKATTWHDDYNRSGVRGQVYPSTDSVFSLPNVKPVSDPFQSNHLFSARKRNEFLELYYMICEISETSFEVV